MSLRCGGICNDFSVANLVQSQAVNEFRKSINISRSYGHEYGVLFFFTHTVSYQSQLVSSVVAF